MPQYIYRIRPSRVDMLRHGPTPDEAEIVQQHSDYLQQLVTAGIVLMAGRTLNRDETAFGIVIFRAADDLAAEQIMQADPAVKAGVMQAEFFPFRVALLPPTGWFEAESAN